ncbi:hypothetical protein BIV57_14725 [Mangrovactinospora gilvigrisea]|uniref:Cell division initiation protein n=1 Tax=Mangrovactinospora gilvigrisea TaxID=1428644 RepID=A0A1J7BDQ0_9ACTN|nr:hypothetical protein [Mangrovactinospora gilvigrisea]OIV36709.1 hypothetical protein BIV57_14725 [Mangrovactinospora gilvigrisea]
MDSAERRIDEAIGLINGARSLPMSSSCVVNRTELIRMLEEAKAALPEQLATARAVVEERDALVAEGRKEAERIAARAKKERAVLVSETEVAREARRESDAVLAKARRDAEETRRKADDYVDLKLATFEVVLGKTLEAVGRGREKLMGRRPIAELGGEAPEGAAELPGPRPAERAGKDAGKGEDGGAGEAADVPEVDVSGFFDTSVIDADRLRTLNDPD